MSGGIPPNRLKNFSKIFWKSVDKPPAICYNDYSKRGEENNDDELVRERRNPRGGLRGTPRTPRGGRGGLIPPRERKESMDNEKREVEELEELEELLATLPFIEII